MRPLYDFVAIADWAIVVPIADAALEGIKLLKHGTLKIYPGGAHALPNTETQGINEDLLGFLKA